MSSPLPTLHRLRTAIPGRRSVQVASLFFLAAILLTTRGTAQDLGTAEQHLLQGHADQAAAELRAFLAHNNTSGPAHLLLCRVFLSTLHGAEAASECRLALSNGLDHDAAAQDWAGRAFGMQASHAGPLAGLRLARDVHAAFEAAHALDPHNPAAANDLGEYYIHAPGIVGGGTDKASALAGAIQPSLPEIADRLRALLAEKEGDTAHAEQFFIAAAQVHQSPGAYVDLATFYNRHQEAGKAAGAARRAVELDHDRDADLVEAAGALNDAHASSAAETALRSYLGSSHQSDQAPAFRAHTMLGQMLARDGNRDAARDEFNAALALAANYAPARKGLDSL